MFSAETEQAPRGEISGWDLGEVFFVEHTVLWVLEDGSMQVILRSRPEIGSLVFVRRMAQQAFGSMPLPFRVSRIEQRPGGRRRIELRPFRSQMEEKGRPDANAVPESAAVEI